MLSNQIGLILSLKSLPLLLVKISLEDVRDTIDGKKNKTTSNDSTYTNLFVIGTITNYNSGMMYFANFLCFFLVGHGLLPDKFNGRNR